MPTATTLSQVNVRIDAKQKAAGDAALAAAGISPSEAVRALWDLAVRYSQEPGKLTAVLFPDREAQAQQAIEEARERKTKLALACNSVVEQELAKYGCVRPSKTDARSFDQLKEDAYIEAYAHEFERNL